MIELGCVIPVISEILSLFGIPGYWGVLAGLSFRYCRSLGLGLVKGRTAFILSFRKNRIFLQEKKRSYLTFKCKLIMGYCWLSMFFFFKDHLR